MTQLPEWFDDMLEIPSEWHAPRRPRLPYPSLLNIYKVGLHDPSVLKIEATEEASLLEPPGGVVE